MAEPATDLTTHGTLEISEPEVIIRVHMTHDRAIDDYLVSCRARGWAESSIRNYAATLYRLLDRLPVDQDVSKTTIEDLRRYQAARQRQVGRNTLAGEEAHLASYFSWLTKNRLIARDPMQFLDRTKRIAADDLDVTDLEPVDVRRFLMAAKPGAQQNCVAILAYLGPRRHAVSQLKLPDYRRVGDKAYMRFREKGSKTIEKPVPEELASILDASIARGDILPAPADYLVPPQGYLKRPEERDDRTIWRLVREVAANAGISANVHAFRRAFAVFYLEHNPDDVVGLKDLLGHKNLETTMRYLRKRNKRVGMERVRTLSWGVDENERGSGAPGQAENESTGTLAQAEGEVLAPAPFGPPQKIGSVEPESLNTEVEPLASGGGRIRTSVGSPSRSTTWVAAHNAVMPLVGEPDNLLLGLLERLEKETRSHE